MVIACEVGAGRGEPVGHAHELGQGADLHLAHDLPAMNLHRHLAQAELVRMADRLATACSNVASDPHQSRRAGRLASPESVLDGG